MIKKTNLDDLKDALQEFGEKLPGWWVSMGICHITAHASCAPDGNGQDAHLISKAKHFDSGFHADLASCQMGEAVRAVMNDALEAKNMINACAGSQ